MFTRPKHVLSAPLNHSRNQHRSSISSKPTIYSKDRHKDRASIELGMVNNTRLLT